MIRHLHDDILGTYLADNVKAREMQPDGKYLRRQPRPGEESISAQSALLRKFGSRPLSGSPITI
jgi:polyphosphate kinase